MSSIGRFSLFFFILITFCAPAVFGQVVAKQGTPEPSPKAREVTTFASPMILELAIGELLLEADGFEHYFKGLAEYECEGVAVKQLKSTRSKSSEAKGTTLNLSSLLRGDPNVKRSVALQYEIVADDLVILTKKIPYFDLEPRYQKSLEAKIQLDPAALAKLQAAARPQLRLTIAVEKFPGDSVKDADEAAVAGCEFLGTISGHSMIGGLATELGAQKAMKAARVQAEGLGATHIVFVSVKGGDMYSTSQSTARAYRCR